MSAKASLIASISRCRASTESGAIESNGVSRRMPRAISAAMPWPVGRDLVQRDVAELLVESAAPVVAMLSEVLGGERRIVLPRKGRDLLGQLHRDRGLALVSAICCSERASGTERKISPGAGARPSGMNISAKPGCCFSCSAPAFARDRR